MGDALLSRSLKNGSVNIIQETGDSETSVMSQKAVTENKCFGTSASATNGTIAIGDYATSFNQESIAIGNSATSGGGGYEVAVGRTASANKYFSVALGGWASSIASYSVALGAFSKATDSSTVSVGSGDTNADYGTRRIVNVKDPVNDQDAVNKIHLDGKILYENVSGTSSTITLSDNYNQYLRIKVFYLSNSLCTSVDFTTTKSSTVLSSIYNSNDTDAPAFYVYTTILRFSGNTVTFERNGYDTVSMTSTTNKSATMSFSTINSIKIIKIQGYNY